MSQKPSVISLFSGAMGLDLGLEQAGFEIKVAVECNPHAARTIRENRPNLSVIDRRIEHVDTSEILLAAGLKPGEATVVSGGPSCQSFSTAGQRGSVGDPRGNMFREFLRVVREARPRFFIMENVRGMLSAAIKHRPLNRRGPGYPQLSEDEELGSAFKLILKELQEIGYYTIFDVLNSADFGVPQSRQRVLFIGSRDGENIFIPKSTHAKNGGNGKLPWITLREGLQSLKEKKHEHFDLAEKQKKYLRLIPSGGNWRSLPKEMHPEAIGGAFKSWGGRSGFLRRLSWTAPAPALTTSPSGKATMLCHPTALRPLSIQEYAVIQQFPREWKFCGALSHKYMQIGNAVPVGLGAAVGMMIRHAMKSGKQGRPLGTITCPNVSLIKRICERPRTILNPPRMRRWKSPKSVQRWLNGRVKNRVEMIQYLPTEKIDNVMRIEKADKKIINNGNGHPPKHLHATH